MRKAALILGIVFATLVACSVFMKLQNIPGYGLLRVVGTGFFCLGALPLQLIYNLRKDSTGLRKTADVVGVFGMWFLLLGILFKVQHWPGAHVVLLGGIVVMLLFGVLFVSATRQKDATTEWFTGFTATALIIIVSLGLGLGVTTITDVDLNSQKIAYETSVDELQARTQQALILITKIDTMTTLDSSGRKRAMEFYEAGTDASNDIGTIKKKLVVESNLAVGENEGDLILNPGDIHVTTLFMVGEDVVNPTGNGVLVYENLQYYDQHILPKSIKFGVPTSGSDAEQDQWVKDNFYHATVLEAATRLTNAQIVVQKSIIETLETKAFLE